MVSAVNEYDIIIVGGGIVGLASACLLSKKFEKLALIDNSSYIPWKESDPYGLRVSAINLASIELLVDIGAWHYIQKMRAYPYRTMEVWEQAADTQITFNSSDTSHSSLGTIVENQVLLTALHTVAEQTSNVFQFQQSSLQELSSISDSSMLVELSDGKRMSAKLIIGADGQQSKVRECIGANSERTHYQQYGVVACVSTEENHQQAAWQCFTHDGPLALLPLAEHNCSIVWSVSEQRSAELLALSDEEFNRQVTQAFENKLGRLELSSERKSFPLMGAQASRYIDHRVALLGDAAHVVHPLAGLGLNLGLADLKYLSDVLSQSNRPLGSERVLRQYERVRKSENILMQRSLEAIDALFRTNRPMVKQLRTAGVNLTNKALPLKMLFMRRALGIPV